ncbi:MAG: hypothetical protein EOS49_11860 [Mesorhizobium sp.]|nr:MAG: hypothetical protein EOS49_11860 [Mesorhizobium sp.]
MVHMVAIYTVWYNFIKMHKTLKMTPAMAAGVSQTLWSMDDLCEKMDAVAPKPGKRVLTGSQWQNEGRSSRHMVL